VAEHGGDPDRIFIMGHSAGCHLVALVATDQKYLEKAGGSVAGKELSKDDPTSYRLKPDAHFLLRDVDSHYTPHRIVDPANPDANLFLARDFEPSPFPGEGHVLYACGYNGSYFKGSLGSAWVYQAQLLMS
jgi:acetyl esterase/lipase